MARLNIQSERVQELISDKVIPLLLAAGSIASLTKTLNDALRNAGAAGTLHPNRLHALLSNDIARGLNEATIDLAEQAASFALAGDNTIPDRATKALQDLQAEAQRLHLFAGAAPEELTQRLGIPPAVAYRLLHGQSLATDSAQPLIGKATDELTERRQEPPDWSYQDIAVLRCVEAFSRRPSGRAGLILPTGAGKTRTALRIVLTMLNKAADAKAPTYWVTHRRNLREQAHRELQKLVSDGHEQLPADRLLELANRIKFVMVGDLTPLLEGAAVKPALIVVDEAHHAAAPSYQPVFANPWAAPVLLLTATPNRGDQLPIGIDEIAFTITYRELAERRAVLTPTFLDFPVDDFDWSSVAVADLADYVIDRTSTEFTKTLVLAPRVDRVEEFYQALVERLPEDHPLEVEDIGYVHGAGNSLGIGNEDFLARFASKPRAVLISAQLLLEGFDDPGINTVVLTYPSTSIIRLMQAAGRCVRYAPGKRHAYVVQARNDSIAYHFDQRWLYQEIDDFLRPQLQDVEYGSLGELRERVTKLLQIHNVDPAAGARVLNRLATVTPGETCRLFLYGLPFFGTEEEFATEARWGALLESSESSVLLRSIFNSFCAIGADLSDPSDFLLRDGAAHGVNKDLAPGSRWLEMMGLLTASYFAKREVHGPSAIESPGSRPYRANGATTWLKYITCSFRPAVPPALAEFLRDCHNATQIEAEYLDGPTRYAAAVKVPLPLGGAEAFLLNELSQAELDAATTALRGQLADAEPREQFSVLAGFIAGSNHRSLPNRLLSRAEFLLTAPDRAVRILKLNDTTHHETKEVDHA
ncbi:DEAD/DEAH box helicase family protein [Paucibacter sp. PLA-PC-4]|uniref:DEAD/DEAH box helicase family protein n=1 Tax=Paucibacter sp. PLA-PC-4 TaxID=2993655 RepID=UPI00224AA6DC|nr:DEAD/DEAH box helicase family protein [Paucibacter sp. PLA-PC-4]MCX2864182.1 DEAD/DEAH box helicase family protein [Paucibacter sp. PLA-PC-4]